MLRTLANEPFTAINEGIDLLVGGNSMQMDGAGLEQHFALARYTPEGILDHSFGTDGQVVVGVLTGGFFAHNHFELDVTVNNVPPSNLSVSLTDTSIDEHGSTELSGSFTDPGTLDMHTITVNFDDGTGDQSFTLPRTSRARPTTTATTSTKCR